MFHCYRCPDDSSTLSFSDGGTVVAGSVMSRIKTRSNYSAVLTMGIPHALELFRKRTPSTPEMRHLFRYQSMDSSAASTSSDYEMETLSVKGPMEEKTKKTRRHRRMPLLALRSISIDVPMLYPKDVEADRDMLVSYSYGSNVISIALPSTNVSGDCSKASRGGAGVSRQQSDVHVSQNELADISRGRSIISERTANIELSQFENGIRMGKKSMAKSDGTSVTCGGLVESQIVQLDPYSSLNNVTSPASSQYHHYAEHTGCDQTCNSACMKFFFSCGCCCGQKKRKPI